MRLIRVQCHIDRKVRKLCEENVIQNWSLQWTNQIIRWVRGGEDWGKVKITWGVRLKTEFENVLEIITLIQLNRSEVVRVWGSIE